MTASKYLEKVIIKKFGFPYKESVPGERGKTGTIYKFWDIYTDLVDKGVAGMRGYVTSSDTPSLDCAMPLTVQSAPLINIRPCRTELPAAPLDADLFDTLLSFMDTFDTAMNSRDYRGFYERKDDLIAFLSRQMPESARELIRSGQENVFIKTREKLTDILGFLRMYALSENEPAVAAALEAISADLFGVSASAVSDEEFSGFIVSSRERLQAALDPVRPKNIVFVMGHKNPDTDTVISSLFEAYRNQLRDPATVYIPVVQGSRIPDEVQALLRDKQLSEGIFLSDEPLYERAYASGQANWILVDQNVSEVQKFVISIPRYHYPAGSPLCGRSRENHRDHGLNHGHGRTAVPGHGYRPDRGAGADLLRRDAHGYGKPQPIEDDLERQSGHGPAGCRRGNERQTGISGRYGILSVADERVIRDRRCGLSVRARL